MKLSWEEEVDTVSYQISPVRVDQGRIEGREWRERKEKSKVSLKDQIGWESSIGWGTSKAAACDVREHVLPCGVGPPYHSVLPISIPHVTVKLKQRENIPKK